MSRRIDCTLTDTQHSLLWSAVAYYETVLEDEIDAGTASPATMAAFNRMCDRLADGNGADR